MNVCIGNYVNLFTDELHVDPDIDLEDDIVDIYIVFAEWFDDVAEAEEKAREVIREWKAKYYVRVNPDNPKAQRSIAYNLKKVLEKEFYDEAIFVVVHVTAKQKGR